MRYLEITTLGSGTPILFLMYVFTASGVAYMLSSEIWKTEPIKNVAVMSTCY